MNFSKQRELILHALTQNPIHPTADKLYELIRPFMPTISLATVYRNLSNMADRGLLQRIGVPGGADHYDHTLQVHYHVLCTHCGALEDIWLEKPAKNLMELANEKSTFSIQSYQLVFNGVCPCCEAKQRKENPIQ